MEKRLEGNPNGTALDFSTSLLKGLGWGAIGGIAGTLAMDLTLMAILAAFGSPVLTCFSIVGDTAAIFFSMQNMGMTGTILLGVAIHYMVGPLIGAIFGLLVTHFKGLRVSTRIKSMLLGIVYVEILSQPLLATTPILLKMSAAVTLQWYSGSFFMHMIAGAVLGEVVDRGLNLVGRGRRREA
ncbi:MAG: hypothetical protein CVU39_16025 [Chloroflexi bacterium HGW-Chloroflexi-10]|nr:MAG: hypothetical protein CVU39_16025 [Chloroflexi bacterium HGW-Chloroflexi-10]